MLSTYSHGSPVFYGNKVIGIHQCLDLGPSSGVDTDIIYDDFNVDSDEESDTYG